MYNMNGLGREPVEDFERQTIITPVVVKTEPVVEPILNTRVIDVSRMDINTLARLSSSMTGEPLDNIYSRELKRRQAAGDSWFNSPAPDTAIDPFVQKRIDDRKKRSRPVVAVPVSIPVVGSVPAVGSDPVLDTVPAVSQSSMSLPEFSDTTKMIIAGLISLAFVFFSDSKPKKQRRIGY